MLGARALGAGEQAAGARRGAQAGACGSQQQARTRNGRAAGQRAVHWVHSACFWPDLTQYYS